MSVGDPSSADSRPRFNLSPVPSLGDDQDEEEIDATASDPPSTDPTQGAEEVGLIESAHADTTTVTMFDKNQNITNATGNNQRGGRGKVRIIAIVLASIESIDGFQ